MGTDIRVEKKKKTRVQREEKNVHQGGGENVGTSLGNCFGCGRPRGGGKCFCRKEEKKGGNKKFEARKLLGKWGKPRKRKKGEH